MERMNLVSLLVLIRKKLLIMSMILFCLNYFVTLASVHVLSSGFPHSIGVLI